MKSPSRTKVAPPVEIAWSHAGVYRRVTAWPELAFERRCGDAWISDEPSEGAFAAAAAYVREASWQQFLEFMPERERRFVMQYRLGRLEALQVLRECPDLMPTLMDVPALTPFVSAHAWLRGADRTRWEELHAVYHRTGVFGLLEWLGLPALRETLVALRNLADPEIPRRFLAPFRTVLWDSQTVAALQQAAVITDVDLARHCHRLAA